MSIEKHPTLDQALTDVEARFLYNLPETELEKVDRLFFQIEQAWWFYEDFKADAFNHLPHFSSLKSFATTIFKHCSLLNKMGDKFDELFSDFRTYKSKIPLYGVIMLNAQMNKVVLVRDYYSKTWTFPRGKINENETQFRCAIRECQEETGFDATPHCKEEDALVGFYEGKRTTLFVATNIPEDTEFVIQCRKEISSVEFHSLNSLPSTYAVQPFLVNLKRWITKRVKKRGTSAAVISTKSTKLFGSTTAKFSQSKESESTTAATELNAKSTATIKSSSRRTNGKSRSADSSPRLASSNSLLQTSPATAKRLGNIFDRRNNDTFDAAGEGNKGWGVSDMFAANSKLTGRAYDYNGNPQDFGSVHPKYVNYNDIADNNIHKNQQSFEAMGIADQCGPTDNDNTLDFSALSNQSLMGAHTMHIERTLHTASTSKNDGNNEFMLPKSAFKFDYSAESNAGNGSRNNSFDSTRSASTTKGGSYQWASPVLPVPFTFDTTAIMAAVDSALNNAQFAI